MADPRPRSASDGGGASEGGSYGPSEGNSYGSTFTDDYDAALTAAADSKFDDEALSPRKKGFCSPGGFGYRVAVLICVCLITFGSYYAYDNPAALQKDFTEHLCQNSTVNYAWMYSIYSWPNTIQPFFGGILIDSYLGLRGGAILFSTLVAIGAVVTAVSAMLITSMPHGSVVPFAVAMTGRFIFGLGGESLTVAQATFTAKWFSGKELVRSGAGQPRRRGGWGGVCVVVVCVCRGGCGRVCGRGSGAVQSAAQVLGDVWKGPACSCEGMNGRWINTSKRRCV